MTNGKPGDDPLTDILQWELEVYSPALDALVREVAGLSTDSEHEALAALLLRHPRAGDARYLAPRLAEMRDQRRERARARGWEVD